MLARNLPVLVTAFEVQHLSTLLFFSLYSSSNRGYIFPNWW